MNKNSSVKMFMDDDSEEEYTQLKSLNTHKKTESKVVEKIIPRGDVMQHIYPKTSKYVFKTWTDCFPSNCVKLKPLLFNNGWNKFFDSISEKLYFKNIENMLSECMTKKNILVPHAELLFNIFNILSPHDIKCVVVGQDPYPGSISVNNCWIPHATGTSFSVPDGCLIPESLANIYKNLAIFGHIESYPTTGCLGSWIIQGCFMTNATLTTISGRKNVHQREWKYFTDDLMKYLNSELENIVFMVWGKNAHITCKYIDPLRHRIITSSHPSPLSYHQTVSGFSYGVFKDESERKPKTHKSFSVTDHFGKTNKYLVEHNKNPIIWDILNIREIPMRQ